VLTAAADMGVTFWDTSDIYGPLTNEQLLGRWFKETGRRNEIFLCTKFAISPVDWATHGERDYVLQACDASLARLGTDHIDLYYQHRIDPKTPVEETVGALKELVEAGKVKYIGLSEASADTIRRAHKIHPISAYQIEYSPFALDIEKKEIGVLDVCRELGITVVAYSPLGRGILTGTIKSRADLEANDWRLGVPRWSEENFPKNLQLVDGIKAIADKKGVTPGQISLAWLLHQGQDVIPIPGTKKLNYLKENSESVFVNLTKEEIDQIRDLCQKAEPIGERYPAHLQAACFGDSAPKK